MAHEITETDALFSVRRPTWHGLGAVLSDYPTRREAQQIAHPWEPITEEVYRRTASVDDKGVLYEGFEKVPGFVANVRSDNGHTLGVVSDGFQVVTNEELWDIAEALQGDAGDVMFETGGSLKGGAKVWALLKLTEPLVVKGDPNGATVPYYSLQNSHDGSGAFRGQATVSRIICSNTAHVADLDAKARGTEFTFRHTKNVGQRVAEARQALAGWRTSLEEWKQLSELLIGEKFLRVGGSHQYLSYVEAGYLERFIPEPAAEVVSDRVRANIDAERAKWKSAYLSVTGEGIRGTTYGLVQASIEYTEHLRTARSPETRFKRAYLDRSALVASSVKLAREAVHA